eukprot:g6764.t1
MLRQHDLGAAVTLLCFLRGVAAQYGSCTTGPVTNIGNGRCDAELNIASCGYDGGDCCSCTCLSSDEHSCAESVFDCLYPSCDDAILVEEATCVEEWLGDGYCDSSQNSASCGYDGGDACFDPAVVAEFPDCTGDWIQIGDGICNDDINVASCGSACTFGGFDCLDPDAGDEFYECEAPPLTPLPCSSEAQQEWVVDDAAQAHALATAVYCSGGSFSVEWRGVVVIGKPIYVVAGTTLNITVAEGSMASIDGNSSTRLFTVVNAALHLDGLNVSYGASMAGGAIAATASMLTFNRTTFAGNTAASDGGAVFVSDASSVSCAHGTTFVENRAGNDGGAMFASDGSEVSCGGRWLSNFAGSLGGALRLEEKSIVSWREGSAFEFNIAGRAGGALSLANSSMVSWDAPTGFYSNNAGVAGGALSLSDLCTAFWQAETGFFSNSAGDSGGALLIQKDSNVSWSGAGSTVFERNQAAVDGGAIAVIVSSYVSWGGDGNTTFGGNQAGDYGGAFVIADSSCVLWTGDGNTAFGENQAGQVGGALAISTGSNVSWSGDGNTTFGGNQAVQYGGAFAIFFGSHLSWSGDGNTLFDGNQAGLFGGALDVLASSYVSWSGNGNTTFNGNQAGLFGGGMALLGSSQASSTVDTTTTFSGNSAEDGGALWVTNSSLYLYGASCLEDNAAVGDPQTINSTGNQEFFNISRFGGGAVFLLNATAAFNGPVSFTGNRAGKYGGAIYILVSSVSWNAPTTTAFHNTADFGGAVDLYRSNMTWNGQAEMAFNNASIMGGALFMMESHVSWAGQTIFSKNVAGFSGGALYVAIDSTFEFHGDTTFAANEAVDPLRDLPGAGGAVSVSYNSSVVWREGMTEFIGNVAVGFGSAMHLSHGSHASWSGLMSKFVDNSADFWGALYVAGSEVSWSEETLFEGNNASSGGAIILFNGSHVGWTGETTFVSNAAAIDGGAVASPESDPNNNPLNSTLHIGATTTFSNNTSGANGGTLSLHGACALEVDPGVEVSYVGNSAGVAGGAVFVSGAGTGPAFFGASFVSNSAQVGGAVSAFVSGNSKSVNEAEPPDPTTFDRCFFVGNRAATGGAIDSAAGYDSIFDSTFENNEAWTGGALRLAGTASIDGCSFVENFSGDGGGAVISNIGTISRMSNLSFSGNGFNCPAGMFLDYNTFTEMANVTYPAVYQTFLDGLNVVNFDLSWILSAGCIVDVDFHDRLLMSTIGPIVAVLFLGCTYAVAVRIHRGATETLQNVRHKHVSLLLLLTFVVYSSVTSVLFSTFACEVLDDGKDYLRSDYRIECDSPKHRGFKVYAGLMIVVYTAGIPAFYASLLWTARDLLRQEQKDRGSASRVSSTSDLWSPYKPAVFYYELIECARRILLAGVVVFIYPNSAAQIAITLMVAFAFVLVSEGLAPYASKWDHWISRTGHVVVVVSMYVALLLRVDVSDERSSSQKVFEAVLVAVHVVMVLVVLAETIMMGLALRAERREDPLPRLRSSNSRGMSYEREVEEEGPRWEARKPFAGHMQEAERGIEVSDGTKENI